MSTHATPTHPSNRVAVALLIAALACWIGFHFLPIDEPTRGWQTWQSIWVRMTSGPIPNWRGMVFISSFLTLAILVTASPFVTNLFRASRICRRLAIGGSGFALLCLGWITVDYGPYRPALSSLLATMALNFAGLICLRAPRSETGPEAP
jgi:hypothetical protein